jgi:2-methylcitrate dehydratase PrpD
LTVRPAADTVPAGKEQVLKYTGLPMQKITRLLARYACASRYETLPPSVRHEGLRAWVNYVGCAAGGSREDNVMMMLKFLGEFNGGARATVIGHREKLDALNASFINAMSSAALAFNDTHYATVAHPTSPVAAVLLALAEHQPHPQLLSGRELLHALILGVEIQCRVGMILVTPPAQSAVGLSMQGIVGGIGAAVAAGKVLGLDESQLATALGLAVNQAAGLRQAQSTMASHFTPGHAARCGLQAALLAARGFECSDNMIEGFKGFGVSFAREPNFDAAVDKLGEVFEILTLAYKPYPAGVVIHAIIDACLEIALRHDFDAERIERVELDLNPLAAKLTDLMDPMDRGQALVSLQYWTAATLIGKAAGVAQVSDAALRDPAIRALHHKVSYSNVDSVGRDAAHLRVLLDDGTTLEAQVAHCRGSIEWPLTDDDITVKTRAQLQTVYAPAHSDRLLAQSWQMEDCASVAEYCTTLALEEIK